MSIGTAPPQNRLKRVLGVESMQIVALHQKVYPSPEFIEFPNKLFANFLQSLDVHSLQIQLHG